MRASIVFSTMALASAAFAAPLVGQLTSTVENEVEKVAGGVVKRLSVPEVSGVESEVEQEVDSLGLTSTLGSAGVKRGALVSVSGVVSDVEQEVDSLDLTKPLDSTGIVRRIDTGSLVSTVEGTVDPVVSEVTTIVKNRDLLDLGTVTSLLQTVLSTATGLEGKLTSIVGEAESGNVEGVLSDAEGDVQTLIDTVQELSNDTGLGLSLGALDPLLNTVTGELTSVLSIVQGLIGQGVTGDAVNTIESTLQQVLSTLSGLNL